MRILILGGSGFVGRNILDYLKKFKKLDIVSHTRDKADLESSRQFSKFLKNTSPDLIINAAGHVGGILRHINNNYNFLYKNSKIYLNIMNTILEEDFKYLINLSSSCAYPINSKLPFIEDDFKLGKLEYTNEGYALSKHIIHKLIEYANTEKKRKFKTIVPCNLFGEHDSFQEEKSHLIASIIKKTHNYKIGKIDKITIYGSGKPKRQFAYIKDLSKFIKYFINNYEKMPSTINFASSFNLSVEDYYKKITKILLKEKVKFIFDRNYPDGVSLKNISITKLKRTGFNDFTHFDTAIKNTYKYYSKLKNK